MSDENVGWLVELPKPIRAMVRFTALQHIERDVYTAEQLHAYADARVEAALSAHGHPLVDEALVERACRAVCIANKWDPDMPVMYAGTLRSVKHPDGSPVLQWEMHAETCRIALSVALEGAAP